MKVDSKLILKPDAILTVEKIDFSQLKKQDKRIKRRLTQKHYDLLRQVITI